MDLVISEKSGKPIYEQIYEQLASQILKGELKPDFCLPSIRVIACELGISIITIKKAWEMLEENKFIYTKAGKGCFVAEYAGGHIEGKKTELALERLEKDLPYYRGLGFSKEEFIELIKRKY